MSSFRDEVGIIPKPAWAIAAVVFIAMVVCMLIPVRQDAGIRVWPAIAKAALILGPSLLLLCYVLLVGYVNADARRRGMRYVLWTLLAILIPNAIGIILYFVLRDPLTQPCPNCGTQLRSGFGYCPKCGAALSRACPQCRAAVEPGWSHCVKCGAALPPG